MLDSKVRKQQLKPFEPMLMALGLAVKINSPKAK